jgi:predicted RNA-binding Zn-ribbon protein involved in translation (DUF1610 family)
MKSLSTIERMIDKACGFNPESPTTVILRCPKCKRQLAVKRHETDLEGTQAVEFPCPKCHVEGGFDDPVYFDKNGKQILPKLTSSQRRRAISRAVRGDVTQK